MDENLMSLTPGTVIAGRYEVVKCLGQGSMGLVYACRHRELSGHLVAVKVLFPEVAQDRIAAARFRNEIFASYGVSHPNVVRAYEFIRDGDLVAYTMEYVGGGDLADRLGRHGERIPIAEVVRILSQMCLGVQAIHDAGIVHRDLKPENILLTKDGQVKIADFGIAKAGHGPKLTEHGGVVGTIDYVSPEYMLNSHVDWRSDIYAMGILAFEMVTGESPFKGDSVYATMTKRLKTDPPNPSSLRSECPGDLDRIILRAMHRDPESRYQSATDMYSDLQDLLPASQRVAAPPRSQPEAKINGIGGDPRAADVEATAEIPLSGRKREQNLNGAGENKLPDWDSGPSDEDSSSAGGTTEQIDVPAMEEPAREENPTTHDPIHIDRVMRDHWEGDASGSREDLQLGSGNLSASRLHDRAVESRGLRFFDVLTVVLAVLVGVGAGFGILKFAAPQLLARFEQAGQHLQQSIISEVTVKAKGP